MSHPWQRGRSSPAQATCSRQSRPGAPSRGSGLLPGKRRSSVPTRCDFGGRARPPRHRHRSPGAIVGRRRLFQQGQFGKGWNVLSVRSVEFRFPFCSFVQLRRPQALQYSVREASPPDYRAPRREKREAPGLCKMEGIRLTHKGLAHYNRPGFEPGLSVQTLCGLVLGKSASRLRGRAAFIWPT